MGPDCRRPARPQGAIGWGWRAFLSSVRGRNSLVCRLPDRPQDGGGAPLASRGAMPPRVWKKRGSAGAEALRSCSNSGQPRGARAGYCRAEGAITSSAGSSVRLSLLPESLSRPGPRAAAPQIMERRCRRASVRSVAIAHSLDPRPRNPRRANLASDAATVRTPASTGHRPCPASAAQLMRPLRAGVTAV